MKYLKKALLILDKKNKKKFIILVLSFIVLSCLEIIGIGMILPLLAVIFEPDNIPNFKHIEVFKPLLEANKDILILIFCLAFFLIFLVKNIFNIFVYSLIYKFNNNLYAEISSRILNKFFRQDFIFFSEKKQGTLINIMTSEANIFCNQYMDALMILLSEIIIFISLILLVVFSGRQESFIILMPLVIIVAFLLKFVNKSIKKKSLDRVSLGEQSATLGQRIFLSIRDIFFSSRANFYTESYYRNLKSQAKINCFIQTIQLLPRSMLELFGLAILLATIIILYFKNLNSEYILSTITFYFIISYRLIPSYNRILVQFQRMKYCINSADIIYSNLSLQDKRMLIPAQDKTLLFSNSIELKDYNFSFLSGKEVYKNLNFKLKKGDRIGICGSSGSGKSTFLNLITMLFQPQKGKFFVDQKLIKEQYEIRLFQNKVTYVSQDTYLFEDSIKNNIILNDKKNFDQDKLNYAMNFSQLNSALTEFENGINYIVGSHSRRISSGQRQRIALARAIYNLKDILILDEATNALDEKNESSIFENLYKLKKNVTIIIVSHNLKNLSKCDQIYEVNNFTIKKID